jgi:hypothetical protein
MDPTAERSWATICASSRRQKGADASNARIDAEIARHKWLIDDGGFVPMLDHSAPSTSRTIMTTISWSN